VDRPEAAGILVFPAMASVLLCCTQKTMSAAARKRRGAFYTPEDAAASLVRWAVHQNSDRMLDPSCGDGRFLRLHPNSTGVESDRPSAAEAQARAPHATIHADDFFRWASETRQRFECAAGNPPFIRYQTFCGDTRERALKYCAARGVSISALTSSWAPFLVAAASLLKPGGRMAFVVPAEIGHASYAKPLVEFLLRSFSSIDIVAVKEKIFPDLSEDVWLLYTEGYGGQCNSIHLSLLERFSFRERPPRRGTMVSAEEWRSWNGRLRPFLVSADVRDRYQSVAQDQKARRLGDLARVGIGYVTGANEFFHLRPSAARTLRIPSQFLRAAVRNGRALGGVPVTESKVQEWIEEDQPVLLLKLEPSSALPSAVRRYLDSEAGLDARQTYKCRNRDPWYAVPDVHVPDAFLTYMSGSGPSLVANPAKCVGTNSVHTVRLKNGIGVSDLVRLWNSALRELSCEFEGHPLGGGMLKIEPREASRIVVGHPSGWTPSDDELVRRGLSTLRSWRHCG